MSEFPVAYEDAKQSLVRGIYLIGHPDLARRFAHWIEQLEWALVGERPQPPTADDPPRDTLSQLMESEAWAAINQRRCRLIEAMSRGPLDEHKREEYERLQALVGLALDLAFPHPPGPNLNAIEARLTAAANPGGELQRLRAENQAMRAERTHLHQLASRGLMLGCSHGSEEKYRVEFNFSNIHDYQALYKAFVHYFHDETQRQEAAPERPASP